MGEKLKVFVPQGRGMREVEWQMELAFLTEPFLVLDQLGRELDLGCFRWRSWAHLRLFQGYRVDSWDYRLTLSLEVGKPPCFVLQALRPRLGCEGLKVETEGEEKFFPSRTLCVEYIIGELLAKLHQEGKQVLLQLDRPLRSDQVGGLIDLSLPLDLGLYYQDALRQIR
ncbi:hypothetical protein J7L13_02290 [bacterium]|nr:hypothetical protein [bacterium]